MTLMLETLSSFFNDHDLTVLVEVTRVRGSTPREKGAFMLVAENAVIGTIGGGQLEYMAIDEARALLKQAGTHRRMNVPLGPEIGQCCGGRVEIALSVLDAAGREDVVSRVALERVRDPEVLIFGAGHVGRATAAILAMLPVHTILIDSREEELSLAPDDVETRLTPLPEAEIAKASAGAAYLILTHDHALDFLIAAEALNRADACYVGMIGSGTKRASFENWCRRHAETPVDTARLVCPIGSNVLGGAGQRKSGDKRPEVIATFVAAEIMASIVSVNAGEPVRVNG